MASRFAPGTLERSVARFGRFPGRRRGAPFKKKQFLWKYVIAEDVAIDLTPVAQTIGLFDATDWQLNAAGSGVRNVSLDLQIVVTYTPAATTLAYNSWMMLQGIWCKDLDDPSFTLASDYFIDARALRWNMIAQNTGEQPTANGVSPDSRTFRWHVKAKQRFMRLDDELLLVVGFEEAVATVINDARLFVFGRISWEAL